MVSGSEGTWLCSERLAWTPSGGGAVLGLSPSSRPWPPPGQASGFPRPQHLRLWAGPGQGAREPSAFSHLATEPGRKAPANKAGPRHCSLNKRGASWQGAARGASPRGPGAQEAGRSCLWGCAGRGGHPALGTARRPLQAGPWRRRAAGRFLLLLLEAPSPWASRRPPGRRCGAGSRTGAFPPYGCLPSVRG